MGAKEAVAGTYIEEWHDRTKNWLVPPVRQAIVIGWSPGNIGNSISSALAGPDFHVNAYSEAELNPLEEGEPNWGKWDTAIFNNGDTNLDWIEDQPWEKIDRVIESKLSATIHGVSDFARLTLDKPYIKNIVLIGSMAHRSVLNGSAPYCAACAGLVHFGRCIAWELAPKGYRVFIVNPSNVEGTPMTEKTIQGLMKYRLLDRDDAEAYWGAVRALPEWLQAADIGKVVKELVTNDAMRWLSGVPLDLGGGLR